jgi:hypothetical protein
MALWMVGNVCGFFMRGVPVWSAKMKIRFTAYYYYEYFYTEYSYIE